MDIVDRLRKAKSGHDLEAMADKIALYHGGKALEERITRFISSPNPDPGMEQAKLDAARHSYFNYFNPIVNYYASFLFNHPIILNSPNGTPLSSYWQLFKNDCDGKGTDLHDFLRERLIQALITGIGPYVAVLPTSEIEPQNLQEYESMGLGNAYLKPLKPESIRDWGVDEEGNLTWVKAHTVHICQENPLDDPKRVERIEIWTQSNYQVWEISSQGGWAAQSAMMICDVAHGFDRCPVELFHLPCGYQLGEKIKDPQVYLFKTRIKRSINSAVAAKPLLSISGPLDQESKDVAEAIYGNCVYTDPAGKASFITPENTVIDSLLSEEKTDRAELFRLCNLTEQGLDQGSYQLQRSGYARIIDADAGRQYLKSLGHYVRESITRILDTISEARGEASGWGIAGFEHLEALDPLEILNLKKDNPNLFNSKLANAELEKRIVTRLLPDLTESQRSEIFAEIDSMEENQPKPLPTDPNVQIGWQTSPGIKTPGQAQDTKHNGITNDRISNSTTTDNPG